MRSDETEVIRNNSLKFRIIYGLGRVIPYGIYGNRQIVQQEPILANTTKEQKK